MAQQTLFEPGLQVKVRAKPQVRFQVYCRICGWKGLYSECEKDERRSLRCPGCHAHKLLDREEKEDDFVRDDAKEVASRRRLHAVQEQGFRDAKATMAAALVTAGYRM